MVLRKINELELQQPEQLGWFEVTETRKGEPFLKNRCQKLDDKVCDNMF